ncbi:GMC oxidoreductase [Xylariaceae sp. FL0594]|nr:GMC oxidoreductase [Xylariaceae sp. FL0594]
MGLYNKLPEDVKEVDVIIAGGGTAACIIAGRLAEADPNLSVLVIEGGMDNYGNPDIVQPGRFLSNIAQGSKTALFYKARKSDHLAGREVVVPCGGVLGGGSSINFMMYTRAQRADFNAWKTPGWSTDELYPFIKKLETYHGPRNDEYHGYSGPVHVSDGTMRLKHVEDDFLRAAGAVGWSETADLQTLDHNDAVARSKRYVSPDGKRSDTAHMYVHPLLRDGKHPNLHVLVESQVVRVLFDEDKRAVGAEFQPNPRFQTEHVNSNSRPPKFNVRARNLVVVSCGACGTPSVLERSGVGRKDILEKVGVPVVEDLPGVGHDYQDHHLMLWPYRSGQPPSETMDELFSGRLSFEDAEKRNDPRLGWNTLDAAGKIRPTEKDLAGFDADQRAAWDRDFKDNPNKPLMLLALLNAFFGDQSKAEPGQYITIGTYTAYPHSRGHLHITGPEVDDPLEFNAGYFSDAGDVDIKTQMWAYKRGREIMRRMSVYRGELEIGHPPFASTSRAACVKLSDGLVSSSDDVTSVEDLEYTAEDDEVLARFLRENINTTWHSVGTTKMAPREQMGVVDKDLNVYGVRGLKVADASIVPVNVAANTNNTALVIGEKAADIIMRELGLVS